MEKTDTDHTLTVPEIINELNKHNISAQLKTFMKTLIPKKPLGVICYAENIVEYTKKIFSMYGGEEETVKIQFDNSTL